MSRAGSRGRAEVRPQPSHLHPRRLGACSSFSLGGVGPWCASVTGMTGVSWQGSARCTFFFFFIFSWILACSAEISCNNW